MSVRVKVCGVTRLEDARAAVDAGASALGFNFWAGSPRVIVPDAARAITRRLPALISRVGIFVNQPVEDVAAIVRHVGLDAVQLHGDETPVAFLERGLRVVKVVALENSDDVERALQYPADVNLLVDASDRDRRGGTGMRANWNLAARLAAERPLILAGGLTAENVEDAIRQVRPWAVDVSSGVEVAPGIKDPERLNAFCAAVARVRTEAM